MESYLYGIGLDAIEGKDCQYAEVARRELSDLNGISAELEDCDLPESEKELFRKHIKLMNALWREVEKLGSDGKAIQCGDAGATHY